MISWNGKYFLMDNSYSLIEYDGERFTAIRYCEGYYCAYEVTKMIPIKSYWILIYLDKGTPNKVVRIFTGENSKTVFIYSKSPVLWLFYILPVLALLFVYRLLKDLKNKKIKKD